MPRQTPSNMALKAIPALALLSVFITGCGSSPAADQSYRHPMDKAIAEQRKQATELNENIRKARRLQDAPRRPAPVAADEIYISAAGLIWKRCVAGMSWDSTQCKGRVQPFSFHQAEGYANETAANEGKLWRVPTAYELERLYNLIQSKQVDFRLPGPITFWSSTHAGGGGYGGWYSRFVRFYDNGRDRIVDDDYINKIHALILVRSE